MEANSLSIEFTSLAVVAEVLALFDRLASNDVTVLVVPP